MCSTPSARQCLWNSCTVSVTDSGLSYLSLLVLRSWQLIWWCCPWLWACKLTADVVLSLAFCLQADSWCGAILGFVPAGWQLILRCPWLYACRLTANIALSLALCLQADSWSGAVLGVLPAGWQLMWCRPWLCACRVTADTALSLALCLQADS